jgi:hypothetical protein
MAICVSCGSGTFETASVTPKGFAGELLFVQCESCKGVVGVIDSPSIGAIRKILEDIAPLLSDKNDFSI